MIMIMLLLPMRLMTIIMQQPLLLLARRSEGRAAHQRLLVRRRLLPGYGVDEPETGIEGGDWCQTRPMRLTKGGLPPFSRLPGTLVRLPVEVRSKTALIL